MMQFVKLWSAIECFFAITDEKISEANAKGVAPSTDPRLV